MMEIGNFNMFTDERIQGSREFIVDLLRHSQLVRQNMRGMLFGTLMHQPRTRELLKEVGVTFLPKFYNPNTHNWVEPFTFPINQPDT